MNAATRASLDEVPVPVDESGAVRACVIEPRLGGWCVAWAFDGGLRKEPTDLVYGSAREAAAASIYLNGRSGA